MVLLMNQALTKKPFALEKALWPFQSLFALLGGCLTFGKNHSIFGGCRCCRACGSIPPQSPPAQALSLSYQFLPCFCRGTPPPPSPGQVLEAGILREKKALNVKMWQYLTRMTLKNGQDYTMVEHTQFYCLLKNWRLKRASLCAWCSHHHC